MEDSIWGKYTWSFLKALSTTVAAGDLLQVFKRS